MMAGITFSFDDANERKPILKLLPASQLSPNTLKLTSIDSGGVYNSSNSNSSTRICADVPRFVLPSQPIKPYDEEDDILPASQLILSPSINESEELQWISYLLTKLLLRIHALKFTQSDLTLLESLINTIEHAYECENIVKAN